MPPRVRDLVAYPRHAAGAGQLAGATHVGEAQNGAGLRVRVACWVGADGVIERARYRATTCAALIAYAEAACAMLEGRRAAPLAARELRAGVADAHPLHAERADLVARAVACALAASAAGPVSTVSTACKEMQR